MRLSSIFRGHGLELTFTFFLLLLETGISILFPLWIGYAIDDALAHNYSGSIQLGMLGLGALLVGMGRRVFDSRFYAKIYQDYGARTIGKMEGRMPSIKSARLGMIRELIEFFENALPELIANIIGLVGVVILLATLNLKVFYGSLIVSLLIFLIYWISSAKTISINKLSNDEFEKQVDVLTKNDEESLNMHLKEMMKQNIRLSDLEALNFSCSWLLLILFLIAAIVFGVSDGIMKYGALLSLVMYVFQYIESIVSLPFFYQNWLRLQEIVDRLNEY